MLYTPIQRADRLTGGHDLERLTTICKKQKSIATNRVLVELKRVRVLLAKHGEVMRELAHETKRNEG